MKIDTTEFLFRFPLSLFTILILPILYSPTIHMTYAKETAPVNYEYLPKSMNLKLYTSTEIISVPVYNIIPIHYASIKSVD